MNKLFSHQNERGQGLVEYAIILALVGIVVIAVMRTLGPRIGNTFSTINNSLEAGGSAPSESEPFKYYSSAEEACSTDGAGTAYQFSDSTWTPDSSVRNYPDGSSETAHTSVACP
jgi:pilus assembly protein Flp/PilA